MLAPHLPPENWPSCYYFRAECSWRKPYFYKNLTWNLHGIHIG